MSPVDCAALRDAIEPLAGGEPPTPAQPASRPGVEACLVVEGRVAELIDLEALVVAARLGSRP